MTTKEDLQFAVKRMDNLVEMDDLVVESVKEIHMILLNLKIVSAHLGDKGKRSGITPICDTLNRIAERMKSQANTYKKDRELAVKVRKSIVEHIKNME